MSNSQEYFPINHPLNIHINITLTPEETKTGVNKIVEVQGRKLSVKVPPGVKDGTKIRVKGKGKNENVDGQTGDLYLIVGIEGTSQRGEWIPLSTNLSSKQIDLLVFTVLAFVFVVLFASMGSSLGPTLAYGSRASYMMGTLDNCAIVNYSWCNEVRSIRPMYSTMFGIIGFVISVIVFFSWKSLRNRINLFIKELFMGDKIDVKTGNISNVNGQIFIGKFDNVIANLNSKGQTELADALKNLKETIMASTDVPENKKKEHIEIINQIGEEVAKGNPNKTFLKFMGDGLLSALKAIPDVANAVKAVISLLPQA